MNLIKIITTGIVLTTVVSCSSLEISDNTLAPQKASAVSVSPRSLDSQEKHYASVGIYSSGDKLKGDLLLEESLSDALYKKKVRNLTSSLILPGNETRSLPPVVKVLKRDSFEALLVIKQLEITSTSLRAPSSTIGNFTRETLVLQKQTEPLKTLSAKIEFIDLKTKNTVWSGTLTFQDASSLPLLIQKTADGIVDHLSRNNLLP